jgi:hypothetical protein
MRETGEHHGDRALERSEATGSNHLLLLGGLALLGLLLGPDDDGVAGEDGCEMSCQWGVMERCIVCFPVYEVG